MTTPSSTGHGAFKAEHQVTIVNHCRRPPQDRPRLAEPAWLQRRCGTAGEPGGPVGAGVAQLHGAGGFGGPESVAGWREPEKAKLARGGFAHELIPGGIVAAGGPPCALAPVCSRRPVAQMRCS